MLHRKPCYIIAEAGVNHNGSVELAKELIDVAVESGADAVKFQTFSASALVTANAPKAEYQKRTTASAESQFDMIKSLELSVKAHEVLIDYAAARGICFLSTPFDLDSLSLLTEKFSLPVIKISSGDLTNAPFLLEIARVCKEIILSTGMSFMSEVEAALSVLAFGFTAPKTCMPDVATMQRAFASASGQLALRTRVSLLHCTSEYPAPFQEVNLCAVDTLKQAFGLPVGYSDHTRGTHIALAAVARGAQIIEKHFTLDRALPGPDHNASLLPEELAAMVGKIRDIENALGDGVKRPSESEWSTRAVARKSLVTAKVLERGELFALTCKRPGTGLSPFEYWKMSAQHARRPYQVDEFVELIGYE